MKYLVDEKGNKYIPESNALAIETIQEVLESNKYLTDFVVDDIIATFQGLLNTEIEIKNSEKSKIDQSKILKRDNVSHVDSLGYLHYTKGRYRKSKWNLNQVVAIQTKLNRNYENIQRGQKTRLCEDLGLDRYSLKYILKNLKDGPLEKMVEEWQMSNNYGIKRKPAPLENNPERRKEMGFGGIP